MKKIVFMGTPQFAVPILEGLINDGAYEVIAAVTQPDRKVGRKKTLTPPPVKQAAMAQGIQVLQPEKLSSSKEQQQILDLKPDLIVTAAYGQYVPTVLLNAPEYRAVNVHASLLPKYRGAAPIHYALINGDEKTGVTIMYMEKEMDAGDILSQASLKITSEDTVGSLFDKLSLLGRDLLLDTLPALFDGRIKAQKQKEDEVTYAPMITPEQEKINWNDSAEAVANKIRGMNPFPGAYSQLEGQRFKIWFAEPLALTTEVEPGTIIKLNRREMWVQCGMNTAVSLMEVQPSGKPRMQINHYLQGAVNHLEEGAHFEEI
ncbi:Methionyl-tRNA formyltransferase [Alkalibacterium sp. AK22]|uniref:methionyl-tRNA formyltransferase n=1 Tax=Alkalibacterium sp. AK22 TaxID=1229520 RepID=UPI00044A0939|nr:methionyl-tRNA formyltransferase [Alkalibacterium sp. AK22]EXJ24229.1 Methionyl-tRNA formyltransferase [Alkalibacterium sp. AK22]